jgi:hypothetical protein
MEDSREKTWWEIEVEQAKKDFDERATRREEGRRWREQTGFDSVKNARDATVAALEDTQEALLKTEPTTAAGLIAFLECVAEIGADWWVDSWEQDVSRIVATAIRKFVTF